MDFEDCVRDSALMLTGGSLYERLRRDPNISFDPDVAHAALIYDPNAKRVLETVHREYIGVARRYGLPMVVSAGTWRASRDRVERSRYASRAINQENVEFARKLTDKERSSRAPLFVSGVLGPRGNAYRPDEALEVATAATFHAFQVDALREAQPDVIIAATLPALSEARGIAQRLDPSGLPYILSFVVRESGTLLDGTPLSQAFDQIDGERPRPPLGYLVNCVHPLVLGRALDVCGPGVHGRLLGLRANTSTLRPEELENSEELVTEAPEVLAQHMAAVKRRHGLRIIGGCCGTGTEHIEQIAQRCQGAA